MSRTRARLFSQTEKDQLWLQWKQGESISKISRALSRTTTGVVYILKKSGGIEPLPRKRRDGTLTLAEREVISHAIAAKRSFRTIASLLARSPSTISREIHRNGALILIKQ